MKPRLTKANLQTLIGKTLYISDNLTKEMRNVKIENYAKVDTWYSINKRPDGDEDACISPEQVRSLLYVGYTLDQLNTYYLSKD